MPDPILDPSRTVYDFCLTRLDGSRWCLEALRGQVLLVVNTASQCGFTPQYAGLEQLHRRYAERGFSVLGFPCNQFGRQEPGEAREIGAFCQANYGVSFPMFAKIDVNGPAALPLFRFLKERARGLLGTREIKWNFTKFLIGRDGRPVRRFAPATPPARLARHIEAQLARPQPPAVP